MARPSFERMWRAFPDHERFRTLGDLYRWLGGNAERNIAVPGFGEEGNGCASRISVALNAAGASIGRRRARDLGVRTVGAADGRRIIFAVAELRRYLRATLGRPALDWAAPFDDAFGGRRGIIAFSVTGWADATGHIALWDGRTYREPEHDDYANYAQGDARTVHGEFWELR